MADNLQELYRQTKGFTNVPPELRPSDDVGLEERLKQRGITLLAQKSLPDKGFFVVCQHKDHDGVWMETYRADRTRCERQQYQPTAKFFALTTTQYDATGKNI